MDSDIREIKIQSDVTAKSLDSVLNAGQPELKKAFDTYSDAVAELDSQGKKVLKHIDEMKARSTEYFAEWEKQGETYTNPQIRELSDERRNKLAEIYARVPAAGSGIKRAYLAYLVDLKESQTYLSNDLTPDGITAIIPVAEKSDQDAEALKTSLEPVLTALDEINAELYSGKK